MMVGYSAVLSYHTNPYTCGVARFNLALSRSLGVPLCSVKDFEPILDGVVLLSVKFEEMEVNEALSLYQNWQVNSANFDLFLHGINNSAIESKFIATARRVYAATKADSLEISARRNDVVSLFAPGAYDDTMFIKTDVTLLTFGMAHKIRADGYIKLGNLFTNDTRSVQLEISTALHEGTTFGEDFFSVGGEISTVFGGNVNFLGFLADKEVKRRLQSTDALVAFFPLGVRENNTTVLSAMAQGCAVITNMDSYSPTWMKHDVSIFDINLLSEFPSDEALRRVGAEARNAVSPYTFDSLAKILSADIEN